MRKSTKENLMKIAHGVFWTVWGGINFFMPKMMERGGVDPKTKLPVWIRIPSGIEVLLDGISMIKQGYNELFKSKQSDTEIELTTFKSTAIINDALDVKADAFDNKDINMAMPISDRSKSNNTSFFSSVKTFFVSLYLPSSYLKQSDSDLRPDDSITKNVLRKFH